MRLSKMFLPTLKESPATAEVVSHKLMLRAGMIRKLAAGVYSLLPMGVRSLRKVEAIVRSEMNRAEAEEVSMPVVIPSELWKESGRWDLYGKELLRLKDRHGREFCLGPTHEEVITDMVRGELRSYKQLPVNLYQIQTKFRDEVRPRFGLMRGREFVMKDAYSFHATDECAEREYEVMRRAYMNIFERCGLEFCVVEADSGSIGGSFSHEFMVLADTGEDAVASCTKCDYAANTERAELRSVESFKTSDDKKIVEVSTPGVKTIDEVSEFLKADPKSFIKTLIYEADDNVVVVLLSGYSDVNELKLKRILDVDTLELASDATIEEVTGAPVGFAGPVGLKDKEVKIYADWSVRDIPSAITGANKKDTHIENVSPERDFKAEYVDLRIAVEGDLCPRCEGGRFEIRRGIEVGHIFKLGTKYSEAMGAVFLNENGKERPMIMCCYGIGIGRTAAAAIEQNHDEAGIMWPRPLAPFDCHIIPVNMKDEGCVEAAEALYNSLKEEGLDVLLDDRKDRAGVKFNDADLIGIPVRVTIGPKTLKEGSLELKLRKETDARLIPKDKAVEEVMAALNGL